ncbi:DUF397 domain-containing protein [Lentzea chajnantorensis]
MTQDRTWRKSTYSGGNGSTDCVEVALTQDALVRDSKNTGAELTFSGPAWRALVGWVAE